MRVHYMLRCCPERSHGALSERACAAPRRTTARAKGMFERLRPVAVGSRYRRVMCPGYSQCRCALLSSWPLGRREACGTHRTYFTVKCTSRFSGFKLASPTRGSCEIPLACLHAIGIPLSPSLSTVNTVC